MKNKLFPAIFLSLLLLCGQVYAQATGGNGGGTGSGTVTSVGVVNANGVSGTVANPTSAASITLSLGAITPSSVGVTGSTAPQAGIYLPSANNVGVSCNLLLCALFTPTTSQADYPSFAGSAAGSPGTVTIGAAGSDTNINLNLTSKGSGAVQLNGASVGTVTSFSAGTLSPLFTTSVGTATTTPALSFTLSTAAAHTVLGNNTSSTASPAYQSSLYLAGSVTSVPSTLTIATTTFTPAAVGSNTFRVVLTAACSSGCTIANPSGTPIDGERMLLEIWQYTTGGYTVSYGTNYDFGTAGAPTLSTGANKGDFLGFIYSAQNSKWNYLGVSQGF